MDIPKQYLLMCNDRGMERMKAIFRDDCEFLEVQGMNITDNPNYKLVVTPVVHPVEQPVSEPVLEPVVESPTSGVGQD